MKPENEAVGPDIPQPKGRQRRWLMAGVGLLALVSANWSLTRCGLVAAPQRPLDAELIGAIKQGDASAVARLLGQGANPNAREVVLTKPSLAEGVEGGQPTLDDTALILAAQKGKLQIAKLLLRKGAAVNGTGVAGYTPLIEAVRGRRVEMAQFLLEHGARPNLRNDFDDTALVFAANVGDTKLIDLLLRHGADVNGSGGGIPLMEAIESGWTDAARLLISRGANVNLRRYGLWTALEWALLQDRDEIVPLIRRAGGKGRSRAALQTAVKEATQQWERENPAPLPPPSRDRVLTDDDRHVIGTVLLDLLTDRGREAFLPGLVTRPDILLINKTPAGPGLALSDSQMNGELNARQANDVGLPMREHLAQRNGKSFSLADYKPANPHIALADEDAVRAGFGFSDRFPRARGWIQVYLPGYSMTRDRAVLRFYLGPSAHGAAGTYFLVKQDGVWGVEWRDFAFYA